MSEIKVGDAVWIGPFTAEGHDCFISPANELQAFPEEIGYTIIPDVPGLAALAAVVAEVGADEICKSLGFGAAMIQDGIERNRGKAEHGRSQEAARHIRRLAAALEVK